MKPVVIARMNLRRMFRERANVFFVFIFPMLLILLLGATFGGERRPPVGVVAPPPGALAQELVAVLQENDRISVHVYDSESSLVRAVERGRAEAGLVMPADFDQQLTTGGVGELRYFARPDQLGQQLGATVQAAVASLAARVRAGRLVESEGLGSFAAGYAIATDLGATRAGPRVAVTEAGEALFPESLGTFDLGASSQLLLFIFLTSLTGSVAMIETRNLGVARRMLATPTAARTIVAGEALGRLLIALVQGGFIMLGSLLLFDVNWGDPAGAAAVLLAFALVGSGAGMLLGATLANAQQAGAVGLLVGLGLGALGGAMVPLEVFPDTMRDVAHATPHAWGLDAFAELVRRHGALPEIWTELVVLLGFAAALVSLATWQLRRALTR